MWSALRTTPTRRNGQNPDGFAELRISDGSNNILSPWDEKVRACTIGYEMRDKANALLGRGFTGTGETFVRSKVAPRPTPKSICTRGVKTFRRIYTLSCMRRTFGDTRRAVKNCTKRKKHLASSAGLGQLRVNRDVNCMATRLKHKLHCSKRMYAPSIERT